MQNFHQWHQFHSNNKTKKNMKNNLFFVETFPVFSNCCGLKELDNVNQLSLTDWQYLAQKGFHSYAKLHAAKACKQRKSHATIVTALLEALVRILSRNKLHWAHETKSRLCLHNAKQIRGICKVLYSAHKIVFYICLD